MIAIVDVSYGQRLTQIAQQSGQDVAIIVVDRQGGEDRITWEMLDELSDSIAAELDERGVTPSDTVVIRCRNGVGHFAATYGAWKVGACVIPLSAAMPAVEADQIVGALTSPFLIEQEEVQRGQRGVGLGQLLRAAQSRPPSPRNDRIRDLPIPRPGKGIASGGSTGTPKIILDPRPWARVPGEFETERRVAGFASGQIQLVAGPLYHQTPFMWSHRGLFEHHTLVVMEKFDAQRAIELIRRHRVQFTCLVPTMMRRIALAGPAAEDIESLEAVFHTAAPCPAWLKREWISLVGPTRLYEAYGATEDFGCAAIRGDEWLDHPGSVGRALGCDIDILGSAGERLGPGQTGEIYMRPHDTSSPTFSYVGGGDMTRTADGHLATGDLGHLDREGYLYVTDRVKDVVISGGANVYPAEVESVILMHPDVADAVVIGLPDEEWGERVHALVQSRTGEPFDADLRSFVRERLAPYKVPKTVEWTPAVPRTESGKIRRRELRAERVAAGS